MIKEFEYLAAMNNFKSMQYRFVILFALALGIVHAQVNPEDVEIIRDSYGVPHIYGKTDTDTAYGLAWAHAEDNFLPFKRPISQAMECSVDGMGKGESLLTLLRNLFKVPKLSIVYITRLVMSLSK